MFFNSEVILSVIFTLGQQSPGVHSGLGGAGGGAFERRRPPSVVFGGGGGDGCGGDGDACGGGD